MRVPLVAAAALGTAEALRCQVCTASLGSDLNLIQGEQACWDGDAKFENDCGAGDDVCVTELAVDWMPRGGHQYIMRRKCDKSAVTSTGCNSGNNNALQFTDCKYTCKEDGCNNNVDQAADLISKGKVSSCYQCNYFEQNNGEVSGLEACLEGIPADNSNKIPQQACPKFADAGCSNAATAHKSYVEDSDVMIRESYRGCTPFENVNTCYQTSVNDLDHEQCKNTCHTNNCNVRKHEMRKQCYTCSAIVDTAGLPLGTTNEACWDDEKLTDALLADCAYDEEFCVATVTVEYLALGNQQATISRGCAKQKPVDGCTLLQTGAAEQTGYLSNECTVGCTNYGKGEGGQCNKFTGDKENISDIKELFSGNQDTCYSCYDMNRLDGSVSGNEACIETPETVVDGEAECPYWAKMGCYQTLSSHLVQGQQRQDSYRGCSGFDWNPTQNVDPEDGFHCFRPGIDGDDYNICKKTCVGTNCNTEYHNPLLGGVATSCLSCTVTVNARNETIGLGDPRCWEGTDIKGLLSACPKDQHYCITDMEVDWLPRGDVEYRVRRSCSDKPAPTNCFEGQSDLLAYKDCMTSCDAGAGQPNGCNSGLDAIADRFAPSDYNPEKPPKCKACSYFQKEDGSVSGNSLCKEAPEKVPEMNCPKYAAMGCYEASSFHRSYGSLGEGQVEDDYRGCSTFVLPVQDDEDEEAANCAAVEINGLAHQNCKRTCKGDSCNTHRLRNRHTCYQCTATVNSLGEEVAVGDSRCFENPSESSLVDCEEGQDYCMDELIIDWLPRGDQITRIVRGCSDRKAQTECQESDLPMTAYKDCEHSCTGDRCNNNFKVADKFYPSDRPTFECQGCNYVMQDDGSESGNTFCQEGTGQGYDKNLNMTCPIYAQIGCFTAASVHNFEGQDKYEIYKGCSTFPLKNNGIKEYTYENAGQEFQVTKTFCREDYDLEETYNGCNNEVLLPGNLEDQKAKQCYQCTVSVDQKNNTVGTGEQGCWNNPSERFLQWCNPGEYCATDLEIDWMSRGSMLYRLTRGCSDKKPEEEKPCLSGQTSLAQFKDCFVTCDTDECNGDKGDKCEGGKCGLNAVAELFSAGSESVNECYTCSYSEDKSGNVAGEPFCGNTIEGEVTRVPLNACPVYANRACYQASSSHQDYAKPDSDFEEDYRGCSTFEHTNGEDFSCQTTTIEGLKHLNCKSSCKDNGCNTRGLVAGNTCYSCKVTLDSLYRPIGVGDIDCWGDVKDRHHVVCGDDQPYCTTELKVDWIGRGNQLYELSRGCSAVKPQEQCLETDSPQVKIKDCFDYCENGLNGGVDSCNDNVYEVAKKFRPDPEKPLEGFYQPGCFFCHYVEKDNGEVEGNVHCYDPEDASGGPLGFGPCPMHASTGCYTGSALHITPDGEEANEVYKGCSVFHFEHGIEKNQVELPVAGDKTLKYSTVKETCRGEGCNAPTTRPDEFPTDPDYTTTDEQTETTTTTTTTTSTSTKSTEETPPPDNGGDGDNDNDGGDDGSSAMVASLIVLLASLML